jgi:hypothetical protein
MAMTLVEAAKMETGDVLRSGVIEQFARSSDILMTLPFENIAGNALRYNVEETLPGIAFRGVNESYTEDVGVINPVTEPLHILGGDLDVDKFIIDTMGANQRSVRVAMKIKAAAHKFTESFLKGDTGSDPREFDGLQNRLTGSQLISAGSTAGGAALSLAKLDELIDAVDNPTHLIMNKAMRRRLSAAARTYTVSGFLMWTQDSFGRSQATYNDLPILIADQDNEGNDILPFTEAASSGDATATSVYCVSMGSNSLSGIQNGGIQVRDLGEIDSAPVYRTRVEWYPGIALFNPRGAARLRHIGNLAVVA